MSPFKVKDGFDALKSMELVLARNEYSTPNYFLLEVAKLAQQKECIQKVARINLEKVQKKYKQLVDEKRREVVLQVGEKAWLKTETSPFPLH